MGRKNKTGFKNAGKVRMPSAVWEEQDQFYLSCNHDRRSTPHEDAERNTSDDDKRALNGICSGIDLYAIHAEKFCDSYYRWQSSRRETLGKLRELKQRVHDEQLDFNKTNLLFLGANATSRGINTVTDDFWTSLATVLTGAAVSITSTIQAASVDSHMATFREILEQDSESTQALYLARSRCLDRYQDVEETARRYAGDTFAETLSRLGQSMNMLSLEGACGKSDDAYDVLGRFFSVAPALRDAWTPVRDYATRNPAALQSCKAVAKTALDAQRLASRNDSAEGRSREVRCLSKMTQMNLVREDMGDVGRLSDMVANEQHETQAAIEGDIAEAIRDLQRELADVGREVEDVRRRLPSF